MIIYNVTVNIEQSVHDEWLKWMKEVHIPDVMAKGVFTESRMLRLIGDEDSGGSTYAIQYSCSSMDEFDRYERDFAGELRKEHLERFKDKFVAFRTLLELV
jgi:hypothetical protein